MCPRFLLAPLCALFLAGEAAAQTPDRDAASDDTCAILAKVFGAAANDFADHRGEEVSPGMHEATIRTFGFPQCIILLPQRMYVCFRTTFSEAAAQRVYDDALDKLRQCLPDWREEPLSDADSPGLTALRALRVVKPTDAGQLNFGVIHSRDTSTRVALDTVAIIVRLEKGSALAF